MLRKILFVFIVVALVTIVAFTSGGAQEKIEKPIIAVDATVVTGEQQTTDLHRYFANRIEEESGGRLLIHRVDPTVFGGFKQSTESMIMGALQMSHMPNANVAVHATGLMIYDMPFLFKDWDHMMRFANSENGKKMEKQLEEKIGLKILFAYEDGPRAIFNRLKPLITPKDFEGMKIRVMENPVYIDTIKAFGGSPTPMSVTEIYLALKQGVLDGVDIAPYAFLVWKLEETAKYCSYTNHVNPPAYICVNAKWFYDLPKDLQEIVLRVSEESAEYNHTKWSEDRARCDIILKDNGVQITEVDSSLFEPVARKIWEKYADQIGGWDIIQSAIDLR